MPDAGRAPGSSSLPWVRVELVRADESAEAVPIRQPQDVVQFLQAEVERFDREHFLTVALDGKGKVVGVETVSIGSATASLVHPREVFKSLILLNASSFIVVHNHPSGEPTPSAEDHSLTTRLHEAGELLGIRLLDHLVLGSGRHHSMNEHGQMPQSGRKAMRAA